MQLLQFGNLSPDQFYPQFALQETGQQRWITCKNTRVALINAIAVPVIVPSKVSPPQSSHSKAAFCLAPWRPAGRTLLEVQAEASTFFWVPLGAERVKAFLLGVI